MPPERSYRCSRSSARRWGMTGAEQGTGAGHPASSEHRGPAQTLAVAVGSGRCGGLASRATRAQRGSSMTTGKGTRKRPQREQRSATCLSFLCLLVYRRVVRVRYSGCLSSNSSKGVNGPRRGCRGRRWWEEASCWERGPGKCTDVTEFEAGAHADRSDDADSKSRLGY